MAETLSNSTINADEYLYPRDKNPFGISWEDWSIRWWKWILSMPNEINPVHEGTHVSCSTVEYNENVILVPGNLGGKSIREYEVTAGKSLLFPIINFITSSNEETELRNDLQLRERATHDIDDIVKKEVLIDGKRLENVDDFRVSVKPFDLTLIENNIFNVKSGPTRAAADGYWIFVRPLTKGVHTIHTIGSCSAGKTCVDLTFEIIVT
jgi:hypothetical protein